MATPTYRFYGTVKERHSETCYLITPDPSIYGQHANESRQNIVSEKDKASIYKSCSHLHRHSQTERLAKATWTSFEQQKNVFALWNESLWRGGWNVLRRSFAQCFSTHSYIYIYMYTTRMGPTNDSEIAGKRTTSTWPNGVLDTRRELPSEKKRRRQRGC